MVVLIVPLRAIASKYLLTHCQALSLQRQKDSNAALVNLRLPVIAWERFIRLPQLFLFFFCGAGEPFSDFNSSWETFIIRTWKESRDGIVLSKCHFFWVKRQFMYFYIDEMWNVLAFVHTEDYSHTSTHTVVHTSSSTSSSSPFPETQDIHLFIRIP